MEITILFWNTGRNQLDSELAALAKDTGASIIILSEYPADGLSALHSLTSHNPDFKFVPELGCKRIKIFTTLPLSSITAGPESGHHTIKEFKLSSKTSILICSAHLISKLHADQFDQLEGAAELRRSIEESEKKFSHKNTIAIGDFNMNPFDPGMISASGLNAIPCLREARRIFRTIDGKKKEFFYNPTWNLLGDQHQPAGTYFHQSPKQLSHYWNTLDQAIFRPSAAKLLVNGSLKIITSAGSSSLASSSGRPKSSDHFPISLSLKVN